MNRIWLFFVFLTGATAAVVPNQYIVTLSGEPVASFAARNGRRPTFDDRVSAAHRRAIRGEQAAARRSLEAREAVILDGVDTVANALIVRIPDAKAARLRSAPGVLRVHQVRMYQLMLDHALPLHRVPEAWAQTGGVDAAGAGVKIGIIDTGIDATHPAFQDPSLAILPGFPRANKDSDLQYTNNKIIVARYYGSGTGAANDTQGHGTGVAMVAAGGRNTGVYGPITGVAPKAYLGSYKVFPDGGKGAPDSLIMKALDDAVADGMDVINLSLGDLEASRPKDDPLVMAVERTIASGKIVVIAAGNQGSDPNTIGSPGTAPSAITVGSTANDRIFAASAKVDGLDASVALPGDGPNSPYPITAPIIDVANLDNNSGLTCDPLPRNSLKGAIALILRGICNFEVKLKNAEQAGAVAALVYTDADRPDPITMSVVTATLPAEMVSYPNGSAVKNRLIANPETQATLNFTVGPFAINANRLSGFSSRGPNADAGIKPDLVATGSTIYTANPTQGATPCLPNAVGYCVESGTSFSSPMVAGAAAVLVGARPGLTGQQYRSLVINSARPLAFNPGIAAPVLQVGSGSLDLLAAVQNSVIAFPASLSLGIGDTNPNITRTLKLSNAGPAADTYSISVQSMGNGPVPFLSTNSLQLGPGESREISVAWNATDLAPGAYQGYIHVQGGMNQVDTRIPYWFGIPSQTPKYLTVLNPFQENGTGKPNSRQYVTLRATDAAGISVSQLPTVSVSSGGGTVISVESNDDEIPGAYVAIVRLGPISGRNVFRVQFGELTQDVVFVSSNSGN